MAENMSFLPEDYLEKKIARRTNIVFVALFSLMLVTVLGADFVSRQQSVKIRDELSAKNQQFEQMRKQFEEIESLEAEKRRMQQMANVTATLKDNVLKSNVFSELINNMPSTLRLDKLKLETKADKSRTAPAPKTAMEREKLRRAAATGDGSPQVRVVPTVVDLSLTGFAPNDVAISDYIGALNSHPLFRAVNLQFTEESKDGDEISRKFTVDFQLDPDFDPTDFQPLRRGGLQADPMSDILQLTPGQQVQTPADQLGEVPTD